MVEDYRALIEREAVNLTALREAVLNSVAERDRTDEGMRRWAHAVREFHAYESGMDELVNRACSDDIRYDTDVGEFTLCFLEANPMFFRSGFIKQEMLRRIHNAPFDESQRRRLNDVLFDAALCRGTREFRYYCKVAAKVADTDLVRAITSLAQSDDAAVRSRSAMMLRYISPDVSPDLDAA